jgi:hypothetical protein
MCVVSAVSDHYRLQPWVQDPPLQPPAPFAPPTRQEFDDLKAKVDEMHKILKVAKQYDTDTGQPDCEMSDKVALLKQVADLVGVDLSDVFGDEG